MDRDSDIQLDPDVPGSDMLESNAKNQVSLSDLYDLPVFAADTGQKAREFHTEEKKILKQVRQGLFEPGRQDGEEILQRIRSRMFRNMPELSAQGVQVSGFTGRQENGKRAGRLPGLALQQSFVPELAEKTENLQETGVFLGMAVIGILCILSGRKKRRHRRRRRIHRMEGCRK